MIYHPTVKHTQHTMKIKNEKQFTIPPPSLMNYYFIGSFKNEKSNKNMYERKLSNAALEQSGSSPNNTRSLPPFAQTDLARLWSKPQD
ncbi:hypothetical protein CEXT_325271 [Caerostris extrusa]|uniref:Uncharacterized protein n=1 Tax=Caerostris extrusa TaxID=172846 RepID=A0AAV4TTK8_CAEEX|nr:hypothetical protein CEXT_325271 [Caerostris extrusa]